jgi:hypothetical protein
MIIDASSRRNGGSGMARSWGLPILVGSSFLASLVPFLTILASAMFEPPDIGNGQPWLAVIFWFSPLIIWIALLISADRWYGARAAWMLLSAPFVFFPGWPWVVAFWIGKLMS